MSTPFAPAASLELLLDTLVVPDELLPWASLLRDQLRGQPDAAQLAVTLRDLAELALEARARHEQRRAGINDFLQQTLQAIEEIEQVLQTVEQQSSAGYQATRKIDLTLERQVDDMEKKLRSSNSVEQVRDAVNQRLAVLRNGLDDGRGKRALQFSALQAQMMKVNGVVRHLHKEMASCHVQFGQVGARALIDPASDLPNRVAFEQRLQQEYARWTRYRTPVALLLVSAGRAGQETTGVVDAALRQIAERLRPVIRDVDFVARFSADTLGMLMPETPLVATTSLIERLRSCLAPLAHAGTPIRLGGSAPESGDSVQALISRALAAVAADNPYLDEEEIANRA